METLFEAVKYMNRVAWGESALVLLAGVGIFLTVSLKAFSWRNIIPGFREMWTGRNPDAKHEGIISPFKSLMTALSTTVGTGNIAGVATAIFLGGPGALLWMWLIALFGITTKYAEAVLAVRFRERNEKGEHVGGPMYYIKNGLSRRLGWLGFLYALFGTAAAFGIGNMVQSNTLTVALHNAFHIPSWVIGTVIATIVAMVIIGGLRRIADLAAAMVPTMCTLYVVLALVVIGVHYDQVPAAFATILSNAFTGTAATGGFAGAGVAAAIQFGVARGTFSNEAGLGSAAIVHATARTNSPVRQGKIAMLGPFIDTLVVCTITGLTIVTTGVWTSGETGAAMTAAAFNTLAPALGTYILPIILSVFALTTIFGWSYYGERCLGFLLQSEKGVAAYRIAWVGAVVVGAVVELEFVWLVADTLNGFMMLPNLIALLLLSPVVARLTFDHMSEAATDWCWIPPMIKKLNPTLAENLQDQVETALKEDLGLGLNKDISTVGFSDQSTPSAVVHSNSAGILAGAPWFEGVFARLDESISVQWRLDDGNTFAAGEELCKVRGNTRSLLAGERAALNFLQTLSGTAERTARYVKLAHPAIVRDTRKTLPGLRLAQKYAVQCGGGENHRASLYDAALIKENHIAAYGSIAAAVKGVREANPGTLIQIEIESLSQLEEVLQQKYLIDCILFDNFDIADLAIAVTAVDDKCKTEASGGITLDNVSAVAATGVDYIAVGDLTKNLTVPDLSFRLRG